MKYGTPVLAKPLERGGHAGEYGFPRGGEKNPPRLAG